MVTLAAILVPQAMAYATLAEMPPVTGLFAAGLPAIVFAIFGSSLRANIGPVAVDGLIVGSAVVAFTSEGLGYDRCVIAAHLAIMTGLFVFGLIIVQGFRIVRWMTDAWLNGFMAAASLMIITSQIPAFLGTRPLQGTNTIDKWADLLSLGSQIDLLTLAFAIASAIPLIIGKRFLPKWPYAIAVTAGACASVWFFGLDDGRIHVVGEIGSAIPHIRLFDWDWDLAYKLLPYAATLTVMGSSQTLTIALSFSRRYGEQMRPIRDLLGHALANGVSGMVGGLNVAASFSRSLVASDAGSKSRIDGVGAALLLIVVVQFAQPVLALVPLPMLAALVIVAVAPMLHPRLIVALNFRKPSFWLRNITFFATIIFGLPAGIFVGLPLSAIMMRMGLHGEHNVESEVLSGT